MAEDKDKKVSGAEEEVMNVESASEVGAKVKKRAAKKGDKKKPLLKDYDIILRPVITEKSQMDTVHNKIAFVVRKNATKPEIKDAVQRIFDVTVVSVNTVVRKGKVKRFRGNIGKQNDLKKAIVTLAEGDTIDFASNI